MNDIRSMFFTQINIEQKRPHTQSFKISQRKQFEMLSPHAKLKKIKQQAKQAKKIFMNTLEETHHIQREYQKVSKKSNLTRSQFIKLYGNKRFMKYLEDLQNFRRQQNKSLQMERHQQTKRKRLQSELDIIMLKNQAEQLASKMQLKNSKEKQRFHNRFQLERKNNFQRSKKSHDVVKKCHNQFMIRKSNISSALQYRAKGNFMNKVNRQLTMLKDYEELMNQIGNMGQMQLRRLKNPSTMSKLNETNYNQSFFLTTKNTVSQQMQR